MAIVFRCPECEHKLRAADAMAGRECRCKCGASVMVPPASMSLSLDEDEVPRGAWRLEPKFKSGDVCEAITAWSPLCAQKPGNSVKRIRLPAYMPSYWQGILVGSAGVFAVCLISAGLYFAFRSSALEQKIVEQTIDQPAPQEPTRQQAPDGANISLPREADVGGSSQEKTPKTKETPPPDPPKTVKKITDPPAVKDVPKPVALDPDKMEMVEWYTTGKLNVIGDSGKEEPLELQEEAVKGGLVFVCVKVRLAPRFLEGKKFVLEKEAARDIMLHIPSSNDPFFAFGCARNEKLWFAPANGQTPYPAAKDGYIMHSWLFFAPLKDLQTGRTTFQIGEHRAVALTLSSQRP